MKQWHGNKLKERSNIEAAPALPVVFHAKPSAFEQVQTAI